MSAFICHPAHINRLTGYYMTGPADDWGEHRSPDKIGQILTDENYRSVNHRYEEKTEPETFRFNRFKADLDHPTAFRAVCCYDYQSCEGPDHDKTEAYNIVECIKAYAGRKMAGILLNGKEVWELTA